MTIYSSFLIVASGGPAQACQNTSINFYGKNKCASGFSGFNNLYGNLPNEPIIETPGSRNNWIIRTTASDNPSLPTVFLATHSVNRRLSDKGPSTPAKMLIRCLNDTTAVLFEFPGYEMSDHREHSEIVFHTGGNSDDILELSLASDRSVMGVWQGFRSIPFVKKLFQKNNLEILATAKDGTDLKASFDISGLETKISGLRKACHW